jgi:hypothetical protein
LEVEGGADHRESEARLELLDAFDREGGLAGGARGGDRRGGAEADREIARGAAACLARELVDPELTRAGSSSWPSRLVSA